MAYGSQNDNEGGPTGEGLFVLALFALFLTGMLYGC